MKLLVFGKTGQVAQELAKIVPQARFLGRDESDLSNPDACARAIVGCDAVINAAAFTAVDRAETDEVLAHQINAASPGAMAAACAAQKLPFVHISSDYVFDGQGNTPFAPDHHTAPLGAYGRSKAAGEQAIRASAARHVILRTSWVFSAHGSNFLKTMLRLGAEHAAISVVADQVGGPTPAPALAQALVHIAQALCSGHGGGTYHLAGAPDVSWADFARAIMAAANLPCMVQEIPTSSYPTPARRPANSRLDCTSLYTDFGIHRPDWHTYIPPMLQELTV